jgi:tetrahydromethanopterin S-methyltransferase subunit G
MTNQAKQILDELQYKTGKNLDEIADELGYSRPYLSNVKKHGGGEKVMGRLLEYRNKILPNVPHETSENSDLSKLIASNQDLAEANKRLSKTHEELVALMKANLAQDPEGQIGAVVLALTDALLKVGEKAEVWDSVDVGRKELNKMVSANLKTKKVVRT